LNLKKQKQKNRLNPITEIIAIELYDAGILTDKDMPDFPADPGDRAWYLMERILGHQKRRVRAESSQRIL